MQVDQQLKIVLVGNSSVGKSSLLMRFIDSKFQSTLTTIGVDFKFRTLDLGKRRVKLQIWDTAGQQNFRAIVSAYYNGADGIAIVYDLSCWESFQEIKSFWMVEAKQHKQQNTVVMLVGAKSDLSDKRQVVKETVEEYMKEENITLHFETSAKNNEGVEEAFTALAEAILKAKEKGGKQEVRHVVNLSNGTAQKPRGGAQEKPSGKCCSK